MRRRWRRKGRSAATYAARARARENPAAAQPAQAIYFRQAVRHDERVLRRRVLHRSRTQTERCRRSELAICFVDQDTRARPLRHLRQCARSVAAPSSALLGLCRFVSTISRVSGVTACSSSSTIDREIVPRSGGRIASPARRDTPPDRAAAHRSAVRSTLHRRARGSLPWRDDWPSIVPPPRRRTPSVHRRVARVVPATARYP